MKKLVVLLLVSLMATSAFAVIDPDPDMLGVYFDMNADNNCLDIGPSIPFFAYVTITNPSAAEVHGLEFGYTVVPPAGLEGMIFRLGNALPAGSVDLGNNTNLLSGDYVVGLASPLVGAPAVQFVTWQFMLLTPMTVEIFLGPSVVPGIPGFPGYEIGGSIQSLGTSTGGYDIPVATVNGECVVSVEETSFGSLKSLFR